jgi:sulfate transport system substrate-binding protein
MHSPNRSTSTKWLNALALTAAVSAVSAVAWKNSQPSTPTALPNVSAAAATASGHPQPFASTIVFLVRKGNPKSIRDWPDLVRKDVQVVAPDPKTSGAGKLAVLAAWGSVVRRGGTESRATEYLSKLYARVTVPGEAFIKDGVGDVLLTWENEALLLSAKSSGDFGVVYPPVSILAEPAGRPADPAVLQEYRKRFPAMDLFPVTAIARDWDDASRKFFADGGIAPLQVKYRKAL